MANGERLGVQLDSRDVLATPKVRCMGMLAGRCVRVHVRVHVCVMPDLRCTSMCASFQNLLSRGQDVHRVLLHATESLQFLTSQCLYDWAFHL